MTPDVIGRFKKVRQLDNLDECEIAYEYFYSEKDPYKPARNVTTNEIERCIIRLDINKRKVGKKGNQTLVHIFNHFPNGTDYGRNLIEPCSELKPIEIKSSDEVKFNIDTKEFFLHNSPIKAETIFEKLFHLHVKPSRKYCGALVRFRLKFGECFANKFENIAKCALKIKSYFDGIVLKDEVDLNLVLAKPLQESDFKTEKVGLIKFPQLPDCTVLTAFILALLMILYSLFVYNYGIQKKELYIAMFLFLSYFFMVWIIPKSVVFVINRVIKNKKIIFSMRFKL